MAKTVKTATSTNNTNNNNNMISKENTMSNEQLMNRLASLEAELATLRSTKSAEAPKISTRATKSDSWLNSVCTAVCDGIDKIADLTIGDEGYVRTAAVETELYVRNEAAHKSAGLLASVLETVAEYTESASEACRNAEKAWMPEQDANVVTLTLAEQAKFAAYAKQMMAARG